MALQTLRELESLNLSEHCLFCLDYCESETDKNLKSSNREEQLEFIRLLSCDDQGFSNFFWQLLIGVPRTKTVSFPLGPDYSSCKPQNETEEKKHTAAAYSWLSLCPNCLEAVQHVKRLHSELEKLQLLLIDKISLIQDTVKVCSSDEKNMAQLERNHLRKLCEFQNHVISKSHNTCKIPLVILKKFNLMDSDCQGVKLTPGTVNTLKGVTPTLKKEIFAEVEGGEKAIERDLSDSIKSTKHEDYDTDWSPEMEIESSADEDDDYIPKATKRQSKSDGKSHSIPKRRRGRPPTKSVKNETKSTSNKKLHPRASPKVLICETKGQDSIQEKAKRVRRNYILLKRNLARESNRKPKSRRNRFHHSFTCELCGKTYLRRPAYERHKLAHEQSDETTKELQETKKCKICNEAVDASEYHSHILAHEQSTGEKSFACSLNDCERKFQIEENLTIHMEVDHQDDETSSTFKMAKCDVCNICFDGSQGLLEHMKRAHKGLINVIVRCPVCSYYFSIKENLISHMYTHTQSDQQICFLCNFKGNERQELLEHFEQEHNLSTSATCNICQQHFSDLYLHRAHMRSEHKSKDVYICCYCGKRCYYLASLMKHVNTHERLQKTEHKCPECGECFRNQTKLARHRVTIHQAPKVSCEICGNEYVTPEALSMHMKEHNKEGHHCQICDKYYGTKGRYDDHMRSLHSEERKFACELCGFTCKTGGVLSRHRLTHTKPFVCNVCDRRFARRFTLNSHMNMHTGVTFVCHICGYEFHNRKSCATHVKKYHTSDNPLPLYKAQKRRRPRLKWKDLEGNLVIAKNASLYVDPARLQHSGSAENK